MRRAIPISMVVALVAAASGCAHQLAAPGSVVARMKSDAVAVAPLMHSKLVLAFLAEAEHLPSVTPRRIYHDKRPPEEWRAMRYYTEAEAAALSDGERKALEVRDVDESLYYEARYGTPLAYARPLDLLELDSVDGKRILDFGFGSIGQVRLLARLGADVTGVDLDPLLRAVYSAPGDQGTIDGKGHVTIALGRFPDAPLRATVGAGYDLIVAKNTLKRGFIHPDRPVPQKHMIEFGVDDESVLRAFYETLKPGGRMIVYNICPAPAPPGKPIIPWSDGRNPFAREVWERVGFRVVEFDKDDNAAMRAQARALGWDKGEDKTDIDHDLFGTYSLFERPQ